MVVSKIIYTNGILTDAKVAAQTAEMIHRQTGIDTEVLHNGSTPLETAGDIGANLALGIAQLAWYCFNQNDTKIRDQGLSSIHKAVAVWQEVQSKKEAVAKTLAGRVEAYLEGDSNREILLVFHSQGTHVGLQALESLEAYKDRIHVVGIGGMVRIPDSMAKNVVNFAHSDDPVPNYVAPIAGPHNDVVVVGKGGHDASAYLENPLVHREIISVC